MRNQWRCAVCALVFAGWLTGSSAQGQQPATVVVRSVKPMGDGKAMSRAWIMPHGLTWEDYERIKKLDGVVGVLPLRIFPQEVHHEAKASNARLVATTEGYAKFHDVPLAAGRFLNQMDEGDDQRIRTVVVLGVQLAAELFPKGNAVGQSIMLNKEQYVVVGVVRNRLPRKPGANQLAEDYNRDVYMPIKTCQVRYGDKITIRQGGARTGEQVQLHQILVNVRQGRAEAVAKVARELLGKHHNKKDWDVSVR